MTGRTPDQGEYRTARIAAALTLIAVVVFSLVVDAFSADYEASVLIVSVLLGTAGALLAVDLPFPQRGP